MSALQRIDDMVEASKQLLMQQYVQKSGVEGLISVFASQQQVLEDALFALYSNRYLASPATSGKTLDGIGDLVGVSRNGLEDDEFRILLYAKIADNAGNATLQTLLAVAAALFQSPVLWDATPATVGPSFTGGPFISLMVGTPKIPAALFPLVAKLLRQNLTAGVDITTLGIFDAKSTFAFAGPQAYVGGWGSVKDATVGAPYAALLPV